MQWTDRIRQVKIWLVVAAVVIAVASLAVSHFMVRDLQMEERNKMEVWAQAMHALQEADDETDLSLVLSVIQGNKTIPVIVTDPEGHVMDYRNIDIDADDSLAYVTNYGRRMYEWGNYIKIELGDSTGYQLVCYDESTMLKRLTQYPYWQLGIVMIFVVVAIFALLSSKRAEQNKVWVGLSKETAHQLGTPISSLMAWVEILKEQYPEDELIPEMDKDVKRLELIADRFSKIGSLPEPVDASMNQVLDHVIDYMDRRTSHKVEITRELPDHDVRVKMNAQLFEWVIENLCKNAVDAMEGSGKIHLTLVEEPERVVVEVADTGKGIRKKDLKNVFTPGFTTKKRGWGLGLSLAKRIVEEYHKGRIFVKHSEVGVGTTFRVELKRTLLLLLLFSSSHFLNFSFSQSPNVPQDTTKMKEQNLREVIINAQTARRRINEVQIGSERMQVKELTSSPRLLGEADIMRSVQLLPGVKAESDASSGFQVRGGTASQNSILYDDAPVYSGGHLAGLFSAFNDDALSTATLYKGLAPAMFGGAASAVFDITTRSADKHDWHAGLNVGLLSAKALVEAPVVKEKMSLLVCGRRSYADLLLKASDDFRDNTLYFYDVNAKLDYTPTAHDQVQLSLFGGKDRTAVKDMVSMAWSNVAASLRWTHRLGGSSSSQTSLLYSDYETDFGINFMGIDVSFSGYIRQAGLRQNFSIAWGNGVTDVGLQSMLRDVKSAEWQNLNSHQREARKGWENSAWLSHQLTLTDHWELSAGLRVNLFSSLGGPYYYEINDAGNITWLYKTRKNRIVYNHLTWEPRASIAYKPVNEVSIKAGYSRTSQNLHALRNQSTSTPFDRYTMSSNLVKPQVADQFSLGLFLMTPTQDYDLSLEGYYRDIQNVLDYRDGISFNSEIEIERLVLAGKGRSYGVELCARKNSGRLTGWAAYTLAWSKNQIEGINGGQWYTAGNDRRHDIDIVATYRLSPTWTLNGVWVYNSGQAFTAPSGKYEIIDNYIYYYAERNGYRTPDYHRLDVSAVWKKQIARGRLTREWTFGIYNLYNRYNPYLINFEDSENGARTKATQYSLFGIVPSVSFGLKF